MFILSFIICSFLLRITRGTSYIKALCLMSLLSCLFFGCFHQIYLDISFKIQIWCSISKYVEWYFDLKIKAIQTDWKGEHRRLNNYFKTCGIQHRISCPYTHEQIGFVECQYHHIVEMGLALLAHSNFPQPYWEDTFLIATYLINRLPFKVINNESPFEMTYNKKKNPTICF